MTPKNNSALPPVEAVSNRARVVVSSAGRLRHEEALAFLSRRCQRGWVIAPSRAAADELIFNFAQRGGNTLDLHRVTPALLSVELAAARLAASNLTPLGELSARAVAQRAVAVARHAKQLGALEAVADKPGFVRALLRTIRDLRLQAVDLDRARALGGGTAVIAELATLFKAELESSGQADFALRLQVATQEIMGVIEHGGRGLAHDLVTSSQVWLDPRLESRLEQNFFKASAERAEVLCLVQAGEERTLNFLEQLFGEPPVVLEPADGSARSRLQRWVFAAEIPPLPARAEFGEASSGGPKEEPNDEQRDVSSDLPSDEPNDDETFVFFSAAGEGQEAVEVARRIRDLAARGVRFDQVAVFLRQPELYQPLIQDALGRAGIPAYYSRGVARPDPAGRAFLALLHCALENLSASAFAEYLSLGQVPQLPEDARPPQGEVPWIEPGGDQLVLKSLESSGELAPLAQRAQQDLFEVSEEAFVVPEVVAAPAGSDPANSGRNDSAPSDPIESGPSFSGTLPTPLHWERLLVDAAVVGGADRWHRRLRGLHAELTRRAFQLRTEEESRRGAIEADIRRLERLERFALPLVEGLAALPEQGTWADYLSPLRRLAVRALRKPGSVLRLLAELAPMAEVGPVSLQQMVLALEESLGFLRTEPMGRRYGRVFVGDIDEARGRVFEVVFVLGLAEGLFPRRASEDPLLLDEARVQLDAELLTLHDRFHEERQRLRWALAAAGEKLFVSYPRIDSAQARARVPSFYALDLLRAAEGRLPDLAFLAKRASAAGAELVGWPAPRYPERAIDDAEYDLAHLQQVLDEKAQPAGHRGHARFLLDQNPHLARSLRARAWRWRKRFTYADGLVLGPEREGDHAAVLALLQQERPRQRSFSPTALQHFSHCPYRFFLQAVLRLRAPEDHTGLEQLDPLTRGSLFHEAQFEFLGEMRREELLPVRSAGLSSALDRADAVLDSVAQRFAEELAPALARVWQGEVDSLRNDMRGWVREMSEEPGAWVPANFELAFGLADEAARDPLSSAAPVAVLDGFLLRGSIDMVEVDNEKKRLRITDHKTGKARAERMLVVAGGAVLQPVLYALAAQQLFDEAMTVDSGRLFYSTQRGGFKVIDVPFDEEAKRCGEAVLRTVDEALDSGFLPAAPSPGACRYCDYRSVCGPYEELRIQRKAGARLAGLEDLRRLP